jgi:hypothetical protein
MPKHSIVVTSINPPTFCMDRLAEGAATNHWTLIVAGDSKTPDEAYADREDIHYLSLASQKGAGYALSALMPERTYGRKMFGYLEAIAAGCDYLIDTDDDNRPIEGFFVPRDNPDFGGVSNGDCLTFRDSGWVNIYRYFAPAANIWPRGNPLSEIKTPLPCEASTEPFKASIYQGLANGAPDVDAVHRLVHPHSGFLFEKRPPIQLAGGSWCAFNSQNTTWLPSVFPLLYLPLTCSFRMTDIYRGYIAQRIVRESGEGILFHGATVHQDRNEHSIIRDFQDEVMCYLDDGMFAKRLDALDLAGQPIEEMLRRCYELAASHAYVESRELAFLDAWITDCRNIGILP